MKQFVKNTDFKDQKNNPYKVVSLFSGCGGKDLGVIGGFEYLGKYYGKNNLEIIFSNDFEKNACNTYEHNFKKPIICDDIANIKCSEFPDADIVIGGFPCQDFSVAGNRKGFDTERGQLYLQMKRVVDKVRPFVFVAENVEGMTNLEGNKTINKIINDFAESGYVVEYHLFNAADYGVPQSRKRVIIIGVREDIYNGIIPYPKATHSNNGKKEKWVTSFEAIDDLWSLLDKDIVANHTTKNYSKAKFYLGKKTQGNIQIDPNKPSPTIRAEHHGNIEGHYRSIDGTIGNPDMKSWRRLTIRECARIQTFPDDFIFPNSTSAAYKEIGNAVPPVFAWHIFRRVANYLEELNIKSQVKQ